MSINLSFEGGHYLSPILWEREYGSWVKNHTGPDHDMVTTALGLAGEAGEFADLMKKKRDHLIDIPDSKFDDEAGDILWYLTNYCNRQNITLLDLAERNVAKIQARYPNGFVPGGGIR